MRQNLLEQMAVEEHAQSQPAREILRQMLRQINPTLSWRLLYDPDVRKFVLNLRKG